MGIDLARLRTVQVVPPTPLSDDGSTVLPEKLIRLARWLHDAGLRVFLPAAGTGEFHSLAPDEVVACVRAVRGALADDALVFAPVGLGLAHALAIGRGAVEAGADAILVMPPVHPYLCDEGVRDYFLTLADALPLPFFAYKKGPSPSDGLLGTLAREGRLAGVKYAVNDMDAVTRFVAAHGSRLGVYCGTAERFAPFFHLAGARGHTSGAACLCPRLALAMHAAMDRGNYPAAMDILSLIRPIEDFRARAGDSFNISAIKAALGLAGCDLGPVRPPQRRLTPAELSELRAVVEPILAAESALAAERPGSGVHRPAR